MRRAAVGPPFIKAETLLDFDSDGKTDFVVVRANLALPVYAKKYFLINATP